mmetsp:Transcript_27177/g.81981  ORF Transcript_27177/g.81981 Transcript_27177/m.81981 type:complete len:215 (+) Transcript_27177:725-1369(+)
MRAGLGQALEEPAPTHRGPRAVARSRQRARLGPVVGALGERRRGRWRRRRRRREVRVAAPVHEERLLARVVALGRLAHGLLADRFAVLVSHGLGRRRLRGLLAHERRRREAVADFAVGLLEERAREHARLKFGVADRVLPGLFCFREVVRERLVVHRGLGVGGPLRRAHREDLGARAVLAARRGRRALSTLYARALYRVVAVRSPRLRQAEARG